MKNISILFLTLACFNVFSQNINNDKNGYTEIVKVDSISKDVIHQKLKEWISLNYKSANDVIQLDTKEKIILKGNFVFTVKINDFIFDYRCINTTIFSIKEGKYKIDLLPTEIYPVKYPASKFLDDVIKMYVANEPISKFNYREWVLNSIKNTYDDKGYNEKKTKRLKAELLKGIENDMDHSYSSYLDFYNIFNDEIKNTFTSIKNKVQKVDDW